MILTGHAKRVYDAITTAQAEAGVPDHGPDGECPMLICVCTDRLPAIRRRTFELLSGHPAPF